MERLYGEKSYRPNTFEIDFWGDKAGDDREYRDFQQRKIKGNILLAAYYSPVTIQEISIELGVALPYLEDEVRLLVEREYLVFNNSKYLTNIPIFTLDCTKTIDGKLKELTEDTAKRLVAVADEFDLRFGNRFVNENLARWQKMLLCLHFSLLETGSNLERDFGVLPNDGPYSFVNGGGGRGVIWGRRTESSLKEDVPKGIQGIYNGCPSGDRCGSVIAMNFRQNLNAQRFSLQMTDAVVMTAVDSYERLSEDWKQHLDRLAYAKDGKANFVVWTKEEYETLRKILGECVALVTELNQKTSQLAANIIADLAPTHIRKSAEYVGALVYRFNSAENLVNALFDIGWLTSVNSDDKPTLCVVKN